MSVFMLAVPAAIGRLTKDPELRYTPAGKAVATIRLACDNGRTNDKGEKVAEFIDLVTWERPAETAANTLRKGDPIIFGGKLQIRQYTTQDGQNREKAEIVGNFRYLPGVTYAGLQDGGGTAPANPGGQAPPAAPGEDDDVPF